MNDKMSRVPPSTGYKTPPEKKVGVELYNGIETPKLREWMEFEQKDLFIFLRGYFRKKINDVSENAIKIDPKTGEPYSRIQIAQWQGYVSGLHEFEKFFQGLKHEWDARTRRNAVESANQG